MLDIDIAVLGVVYNYLLSWVLTILTPPLDHTT